MQYKYNFSKLINSKLSNKTEEENEKKKKDENMEKSNYETVKSFTPTNDKTSNMQVLNANENNELKNKTAKEVIEDLNKISETYNRKDYVDLPESLNLESKTIEEKSDDDFKKLAKDSLDQKYKTEKEKTSSSFQNKINNAIKEMESLSTKHNESKKTIEEYYDNSISNTENQALKRGLARSSIIINQISSLEGNKAKELASLLSDYTNSINEKEKEISQLEQSKEEALNELDIEQALKLDEEILKLKEEYEKDKNEAIEFNNQVKKLEAEYQIKLENAKQDKQTHLNNLEDKYGENVTASIISEKQYDYLKQYFDMFDKEYALALFLNNKEFKDILNNNYKKMYQYLISK